MKDEKIRVFLADNQVLFREGMHFVLEGEEDMKVVGEGRNAQEALAFLRRNSLDVCVLSTKDTNEAHSIKEEFPSMGLIFIVNPGEQPWARGNETTLHRDAYPEKLVEAIRKAAPRDEPRDEARDDTAAPDNGQLSGMEETKQAIKEHFLARMESL